MTPSLSIIELQESHLDAVMSIDVDVYDRPWSSAIWRTELADPMRRHVVALDADRVVGHAGTLQVLEEVHITTVAVAAASQGMGIATRLVLRVLDDAISAGAEAATLECRASHRRTQRLYARFGFAPGGIRRGYYSEPKDDGLVMWLPDLRAADSLQRLESVRDEISEDVS